MRIREDGRSGSKCWVGGAREVVAVEGRLGCQVPGPDDHRVRRVRSVLVAARELEDHGLWRHSHQRHPLKMLCISSGVGTLLCPLRPVEERLDLDGSQDTVDHRRLVPQGQVLIEVGPTEVEESTRSEYAGRKRGAAKAQSIDLD